MNEMRTNSSPDWRMGPLKIGAVVFMMLFAVEITNYGFSVDEEVANFWPAESKVWIQQGRWGMALVRFLLPDFEAIPFVSTALFGAGLLGATWFSLEDFRLTQPQGYVFSVIHMGFPVWIHIGQFNTLAAGAGIGVACAAAGSRMILQSTRLQVASGIGLLAISTGIYQTLASYSIFYVVASAAAQLGASERNWKSLFKPLLRAGIFWGFSIATYWLIQSCLQSITGTTLNYVGDFLKFEQLLSEPAFVFKSALSKIRGIFLGTDLMYLGWGPAILALSWLGTVPIPFLRDAQSRGFRTRAWMISTLPGMVGLVLVSVPTVLSAARLPIRAYPVLPLLAAWLASRSISHNAARIHPACVTALLYFAIASSYIGATLFYTDQRVHEADMNIARAIVLEVQQNPHWVDNGVRNFVLVGMPESSITGQLRRSEMFGRSFFHQGGGNVLRVNYLLKTLGPWNFNAVRLGQRSDLIPIAQAMPVWPAKGSIAAVKDVLLVKLGEPTDSQLTN